MARGAAWGGGGDGREEMEEKEEEEEGRGAPALAVVLLPTLQHRARPPILVPVLQAWRTSTTSTFSEI